jgi:hypothetical protein
MSWVEHTSDQRPFPDVMELAIADLVELYRDLRDNGLVTSVFLFPTTLPDMDILHDLELYIYHFYQGEVTRIKGWENTADMLERTRDAYFARLPDWVKNEIN